MSEQKAEQTSGEAGSLSAGPAVSPSSDAPAEPVVASTPDVAAEPVGMADLASPGLVPEQGAVTDTPEAETSKPEAAKSETSKPEAAQG